MTTDDGTSRLGSESAYNASSTPIFEEISAQGYSDMSEENLRDAEEALNLGY